MNENLNESIILYIKCCHEEMSLEFSPKVKPLRDALKLGDFAIFLNRFTPAQFSI